VTTALSPILISRLEKAATDNGFDRVLEPEGDWLIVASTQCPLRVWLGAFGDAVFLAAFSRQNVARALGDYGTPIAAPMPKGAAGGRTVPDVPALLGSSGARFSDRRRFRTSCFTRSRST
jgi:putative restriction endonuclease